jgi:hypothetical protein
MASAARQGRLEEAEKLLKKANKLWSPSLLDLRLKPDWEAAAPLYERAALAFKARGRGRARRQASLAFGMWGAGLRTARRRQRRGTAREPRAAALARMVRSELPATPAWMPQH